MRNLKKVLSLVLALMMVLSVMVTANAAFEDVADDSNYKEAIDVLVAAGVLNGKSETSFDPQGTLKRSEAAKIITYILLGGDVDAVTADTLAHPFTDVAKGEWFTNPINYCYAKGIIDGTSETTFNPNGTLDGYAFAKMLLVASGINDDYLGTNYKKNVASHFYAEGLDANLPASFLLGNPLTREQAAQMALNALNKAGASTNGYWAVLLNGEWIPVSATEALMYNALGKTVDYKTATVSATAFGSALKLAKVPAINDAGLNYHYWTVAGEKTGIEIIDDVKVAEFAAGTTYAALLADLGYTENSVQGATWYANGVAKESFTNTQLVAMLKATSKIPAPVEIYVDAKSGDYKLMATIEYVANVTAIDEKADATTGLYTYTFTVNTVDGTYDVDVEAEEGAYSKDVAYLVVPQGDNTAADKFLSIEETAPVTVTVTGKGSNYVRAGSDKYTVAVGLDASKVLSGVVVTKDFDLYLASDESVIWVEAYVAPGETADTTETLVYLTAVWSETVEGTEGTKDKWGNATSEGTANVTTYYAQGVDVDGEEIDIVISATDYADETILNKLWNISYNKETKVNDLLEPETAIVTTELAEKKISFQVKETVEGVVKTNTFYYNTAEYLHILGSKDKLSTAAGNLADAVKAGSAWVIFSGEKTNKTISKVIYWTESAIAADPTDPFTGAAKDMYVAADSVSTDETYVTYVPTGKEEAVTESVWYHEVLINGETVEILYNADTIEEGFYTYYEGAYGYYVLKALVYTEVTVDNVYGSYVSYGETYDWDITGIEVVDLTEEPDGTVDAGDVIAFYTIVNADSSTTVTLIYIVG